MPTVTKKKVIKTACYFCGRGRTASKGLRKSKIYSERFYCSNAHDCINQVPPGRSVVWTTRLKHPTPRKKSRTR